MTGCTRVGLGAQAETLPLAVAGEPRGRIVPAVAEALRRMPDLFECHADAFALRDTDATPETRSTLLQDAALRLRAEGLVRGWRDELCALLDDAGSEIARFERGAFRTLGLQNRAVHVNGWRRDGRLWIARRSAHKKSAPNKLDNLAAGAIAAGETPADCAARELWEEAGVPASLASRAAFIPQIIRSLRLITCGVHDELILCADLELPDEFVPDCQDGEVAAFLCMSREQALHALDADEFSHEAGLVVRDALARRAT